MITREAYQNYFRTHLEEELAARQLDECFDISFGKEFGQKSYWFAKPKQLTRERFGLTREVLVVYSPQPKTDARCITAIDNISRIPEFRVRLDQILAILVHNGDPGDLAELTRQTPDRLIVPFTLSELRDTQKGALFVRQRIALITGAVDLFGLSSPLKSDRQLFGRDEIVQKIVNRSLTSGENSGVFGLRKTGKTSVLYALKRRAEEREAVPIYIDCSGVGRHSLRWWQLLEAIVQEFALAVKRHRTNDTPYSEEDAGQRFSPELRALLEKNGEIRLGFLMLDEIEYITATVAGQLGQHWDADSVPFWQTIRSTAQESFGRLTFIVAGVNPLCVEQTHIGTIPNPIFQLALPHFLEPLTTSAVREMLRITGRYAGMNFSEEVYAYLAERYGGHPYLIRTACSVLWQNTDLSAVDKTAMVTKDSFEALREAIRAKIQFPIRDILLSLVWWYPTEFELLRMLAVGDTDFVNDYLKSSPESVLHFVKYGLLNSDQKHFAIDFLREFLHEMGEKFNGEVSPFRRSDIPPENLPALPDLQSLAELQRLKNKMEILLRRLIIMYLGVQSGWSNEQISKMMIDGLGTDANAAVRFVGRVPQDVINELYVRDLRRIIAHFWSLFGGLFGSSTRDLERFKMNMDTINIARRFPAHTGPVTKEQQTEFVASYEWLFARITKVPGLMVDLPDDL